MRALIAFGVFHLVSGDATSKEDDATRADEMTLLHINHASSSLEEDQEIMNSVSMTDGWFATEKKEAHEWWHGHHHYDRGDASDTSCSAGTGIHSASLCHAAANAIGLSYGGTENLDDRPIGCYTMEHGTEHKVFYNDHHSGAAHDSGRPLCLKVCSEAAHCSSHGTTHDNNAIDGCTCNCLQGYTGDTCNNPPPCSLAAHCGPHASSVEQGTDGCECQCEHGWSGIDCMTAGNELRLFCGRSYNYELGWRETWHPTLISPPGMKVALSTCDAADRSDTVISAPCDNDDWASWFNDHGEDGGCAAKGPSHAYRSFCSFTASAATSSLTIGFYGSSGGRSSVHVLCHGSSTTTPCTDADCNNHGTTHDFDNSDGCTCVCTDSFQGPDCGQQPSCTAESHCSSHGTTEDDDVSDGCVCSCLGGYGGVDCSIPPACTVVDHCHGHATFDGNLANAHGTTTDMDSTDGCVCHCTHDWSGPDCNIPPACKAATDCSGHGETDDPDNTDGCTCDCADNFEGLDCGRAKACTEAFCSGHGTTSDPDASDGCVCSCSGGYGGVDCSIPPACTVVDHCHGHAIFDGNLANAHGTTTDMDSTDGCVCHCTDDWSGPDCTIPPQCKAETDCSGHGETTDPDKTDGCTCACTDNYEGLDCGQVPSCNAALHCSANGFTNDEDSTDGCVCFCDAGFRGDDCSTQTASFANPTHIECGQTYDFDLESNERWEPAILVVNGTQVTLSTCPGSSDQDTVIAAPCVNDDVGSAGGSGCHRYESRCSFNTPNDETKAEIKFHASAFRGSGTCVGGVCSSKLSVTCSPSPPPPTPPVPLPDTITCGNSYIFKLESGADTAWQPKIQAAIGQTVVVSTCGAQRADGSFFADSDGDTHIKVGETCDSDDIPSRSPLKLTGCQDRQSHCEITAQQAETPTIIKFYGGGAFGSAAGESALTVMCPCNAADCNNHGRTTDPDSSDGCICECDDNFEGLDCGIAPLCTPEFHCSSHGTTRDPDASDGCDCSCSDRYEGADCSIPPACTVVDHCHGHATFDGNLANAHGTTTDMDSTDGCVCHCIDGWSGPDCKEPPICEAATDCSGHGETDDPDNTDGCTCLCTNQFWGTKCENPPVCHIGTDCSGRGTTDDTDSTDGCDCVCDEGFRGTDCSIPLACDGEIHCNGHATMDIDSRDGCVCDCRPGWGGDDCKVEPLEPVMQNTRCPLEADSDHLFTQSDVATVHDCKRHCEGDQGCRFFSYLQPGLHNVLSAGDSDGVCIGCTSADSSQASSGFHLYNIPVPPPCVAETDCNGRGTTIDNNKLDGCTCACIDGYTGNDCGIEPAAPPVEADEPVHGAYCASPLSRKVKSPALSGGCQRCTCVGNEWMCACSMRHRKEINDVTDQEFDWFALAVNQMKRDGNWTEIAKVHAASEFQRYSTHGDPTTFLPWHRKFFIEVENRVQMAARTAGLSILDSCSVTIPYWNWALETNFGQARIWDSDRLGAIDNLDVSDSLDAQFCVKDGKFGVDTDGSEFGKGTNPFPGEDFMQPGCAILHGNLACVQTIPAQNEGKGSDCIFRKGGEMSWMYRNIPTLNYAQMVTALREHEAYQGIDNYVAMANFIEREIHNMVHGAIGGSERISTPNAWGFSSRRTYYGHMTQFYSPYDPVFFFHHGFIDYLWNQWQSAHVEGLWRNHRSADLLNNLLFDGNADTFPVTDVAMAMDIKDDDPLTDHEENACVKYHDRQTQHACTRASRWEAVSQCFTNLVDYEKLHTVPRIRNMTNVGDVCDPLNKLHFDTDRMWLETMSAMGMMSQDHINVVLDWERNQLQQIENTTETVDAPVTPHCDQLWGDAKEDCEELAAQAECDKAVCFSVTRMLQICSDCATAGWSRDCHCSEGVSPDSCWESRT